MTKVFFDMSMSLDGFIAGPNDNQENPLGDGGEQLHEWMLDLASWREHQGLDGGKTNQDSEIVAESFENVGAGVMGRGMFSNDDGPWGDDPFEGYWGHDDLPFSGSVFVLTHYSREPLQMADGTTFTFVTDGIEHSLEQAKAAAGDQNVRIHGGANVVQQYLNAGYIDGFTLHVAPVFLGSGLHLFESIDKNKVQVEIDEVISSSDVTHMTYKVVKKS